MVFREEESENFIALFNQSKKRIRASVGCNHLELLRATAEPNIFFTYSYWESEEDLNAYRHSPLFADVWAKTKVLFAERPQAWSVTVMDNL